MSRDKNGESWEDRERAIQPQANAVGFDYSALDSDIDRLCDHFSAIKLTRAQAVAISSWHSKAIADAETTERALILGRVVGELLASENVAMDKYGLAFAAGLDQAAGLGSQAEVARKLKCERAAVSKAVRRWKEIIGYAITKFARSDETRARCAAAQRKDHWRRRQYA